MCLVACGLALAQPAAAIDTIYKYVDKDGVVTYSSTPPAAGDKARDVTELVPSQAPRSEDVEAARKRAEEDAKLSRELVKERRQADAEYARQREAAATRALMEQAAAARYASDDSGYGGSYYLPYYPLMGQGPGVKPRPPFDPNAPFRPHVRTPASLGPDPLPVPLRRHR
ncbi:MAG TPA: DUF4124 domain-containing protein [Burkholderiales bacterium]|nr:DUF4124 domain-containing protein [Burkholderiales bacterium]